MRNSKALALCAALALISVPSAFGAAPPSARGARDGNLRQPIEATEPELPPRRSNAISLELLGRGGLYGVSYDREIIESIALGAGFSKWSLGDVGSGTISVLAIPVYGNYYFGSRKHRAFLTAGAAWCRVTVNLDGVFDGLFGVPTEEVSTGPETATFLIGTAGGGYEFRGDGGFLFRLSFYAMVARESVAPFGGLSLGYAF
jgi:hypothetical protein